MARKTLLTEAELRSFMKLAELRPIGDDRIKEMYGRGDEDDAMEEGENVQDDDPAGEAGVTSEEMDMDMDMGGDDDDAPEMDMDMDMDMKMDAPAGGAKMVSIDDFMGALESALEDVLDDEVEVDMDDDAEMDMDREDEPGGMEMGAAADAMDDGDDDPMMEDDHDDDMNEEEVVNEIARRVAERLQAKNNKTEMIDQLAERILNRLTSK
mgnify:CR=1 FL=1|tara:strand:- start:3279 stop:3908 length:630 start_codon:yes stop_codon:yes gene_type:complete